MGVGNCRHITLECINPYEIIRKYRCKSCKEIMMCECEKEFATIYLPHQLKQGCEQKTKKRVPVTIGFQPKICRTCRGLPEIAYPTAPIPGRTTKIKRYYWREIQIETIRRFGQAIKELGYSDWLTARMEEEKIYKQIEREVLEEIKKLHNENPKYSYQEESQKEIISKYNIEVVNINGEHIKEENERKVLILFNGEKYSAEEFAIKYFNDSGYNAFKVESRPFHVLFGVFLWPIIEDPCDPNLKPISFGDRETFNGKGSCNQIFKYHPIDFGTQEYFQRRASSISKHFELIEKNSDDLLFLFDYWLPYSSKLRNYLWAIDSDSISKARKMISILDHGDIIKILKYLIKDYWARYCGWPDLLVYNEERYFFVEVKSSRDKLSEDQKKMDQR